MMIEEEASLTDQEYSHRRATSSPPDSKRAAFDFPRLSSDGSILGKQERRSTPPAALSSLGARMAQYSTSDSVSSIDDASYDMIDDISEVSGDDHDTVSIASTDARGEEQGDIEQDDEDLEVPSHNDRSRMVDAFTETESQTLAENQAFKVPIPFHNSLAMSIEPGSKSMEATVDDLETPRQSTMTTNPASTSLFSTTRLGHEMSTSGRAERRSSVEHSAKSAAAREDDIFQTILNFATRNRTLTGSLLSVLVSCIIWSWFNPILYDTTWRSAPQTREAALRHAVSDLTGSQAISNSVNYTHLLPPIKYAGKDLFGHACFGTIESTYQPVQSNRIIVSIPSGKRVYFPTLVSVEATRGMEPVNMSHTELIPGVHAITFDPSDAHGLISVNLSCKQPGITIPLTHDFGNRMLQRHTYEKAGTDITKAIVKDVAIARSAAKSIGQRIEPEIAAAMRNVSLLIHSAAVDLTLIADRASKLARNASLTSQHVVKGFGNDIATAGKDVQKALHNAIDQLLTMVPNSSIVKNPIILSRSRALALSEKAVDLKHKLKPFSKMSSQETTLQAKKDEKIAHHESKKSHGRPQRGNKKHKAR